MRTSVARCWTGLSSGRGGFNGGCTRAVGGEAELAVAVGLRVSALSPKRLFRTIQSNPLKELASFSPVASVYSQKRFATVDKAFLIGLAESSIGESSLVAGAYELSRGKVDVMVASRFCVETKLDRATEGRLNRRYSLPCRTMNSSSHELADL